MPVTPTYPGVYIEELPSGVRTIVGVPTSVTAFIGRAFRGPTDEARRITSWADFERIYGGLWRESTMSYAVYQYYQNGGSDAVILRLYRGPEDGDVPTNAVVVIGDIELIAAYPGSWGNRLRAAIDQNVSPEVAAAMGVDAGDLFNLTVRDDSPSGITETFRNLTVVDSSRRIDRILEDGSKLVRYNGELAADPAARPDVAAGGDEVTTAVAAAQTNVDAAKATLKTAIQTLKDAQAAQPPDDNAITAAQEAVDNAQEALATAEAALIEADNSLNASDGRPVTAEEFENGVPLLKQVDIFNLMVIPPFTLDADLDSDTLTNALNLCVDRRAVLLVDPPIGWDSVEDAVDGAAAPPVSGSDAKNAAIYFPRIWLPDPLQEGRLAEFPPTGAVAGVIARTDAERGVWKAPAGTDASLNGVRQLSVKMTDLENGLLNPFGVNCLRTFPVFGNIVWGARTLRGADQLADQWKYLPVRRTALFIEESLYRGLKWVVFEPNGEVLWSSIRLNVGVFMNTLFRQGAFAGTTPREAYLVKCDRENNPQADIDRGIVNILVGFAPLKPAEFVIVHIQQLAGQLQV
jgi:phage tail sheath protein FI